MSAELSSVILSTCGRNLPLDRHVAGDRDCDVVDGVLVADAVTPSSSVLEQLLPKTPLAPLTVTSAASTDGSCRPPIPARRGIARRRLVLLGQAADDPRATRHHAQDHDDDDDDEQRLRDLRELHPNRSLEAPRQAPPGERPRTRGPGQRPRRARRVRIARTITMPLSAFDRSDDADHDHEDEDCPDREQHRQRDGRQPWSLEIRGRAASRQAPTAEPIHKPRSPEGRREEERDRTPSRWPRPGPARGRPSRPPRPRAGA